MKKTITQLKRKALPLCIFFLISFIFPSSAQIQLASWNPSGVTGWGPSPWAATSSNTNMTVGGWTRGAGVGLSGTAANNAWGGNNWGGASNQDATFTITANPGSVVSYSVFDLYYRRSATGPSVATLEYTFGSSTTYTLISPLSFPNNTSSGALHAPINLSSVANLQNVPSGTVVNFRILPTTGGPNGTWYIFGTGCNIIGTVSSFVVNITQTSSISCNGQSAGALTASVIGSVPPYTYSWMPAGGTSSAATTLSAGVYTCFVTSANSETTSSTFTITEPAIITASITSQTNVACHGGTNGSVTVSTSGGVPAYTYSWLPGGGTNSTAINLSAGMYTLNIIDTNNCTGSLTVSITQPNLSLASYATNSMICSGSTVMVNAVGANSYTWTNGISNGVPFSPSVTSAYTVSATNTITGCVDTNTLEIIVNPSPTVTAVTNFSNASACKGSTVVLNAFGADTYTWSGGVLNGVPFSPTITASYMVSGTNTNNCTGSAVITITVNTNPTVTIVSSRPIVCRGESNTLTAGGALSYTWNTTETTSVIVITPTATITYSLTGKDLNGCANTSTLSQKVNACTGIVSLNTEVRNSLTIFPNPNTGEFTIKNDFNAELLIFNDLGQIIQTLQLNDFNNRESHIRNLSSGIYFIMSTGNTPGLNQKVIVTK